MINFKRPPFKVGDKVRVVPYVGDVLWVDEVPQGEHNSYCGHGGAPWYQVVCRCC